ncbi:hypothetical protein Pelo_6865, partial [Pelomyxa schiedti]
MNETGPRRRCSVCHCGPLPPWSHWAFECPSCGHPVCCECGDAIVTFSRGIPTAAAGACHHRRHHHHHDQDGEEQQQQGAEGEGEEASPPATPTATMTTVVEFWCSVCGCAKEGTLWRERQNQQQQQQAYHGTGCSLSPLSDKSLVSAVVVKQEMIDEEQEEVIVEEDEEEVEIPLSPTPTCPKRRRKAARVASVQSCVMCKASEHADVAAKYTCAECTKASPGGKTVMLFCESCWSKAHWTPWMSSHAKSDLSSIYVPVEFPEAVRMCESHQLPLDVFCQTDDTLICSRCVFYSSHKGHNVVSVEDMSYKHLPSPKAFFAQLAKLEADLNSLAASIKSDSVRIKLDQSQFAEKVVQEFSVIISRLQRRQEELISTSEAIASCKVGALSQQLDVIDTGLGHIEKYKSKCAAILKSGNGQKITDLCEALPGILKQLECKAEHLSPCTTKIWISAHDIELVKEKIPHLCFVSPGPVLECIKDTTSSAAVAEDCVTATGLWAATATSKDIIMHVGESECTNVKIVTPGSVLTFTVPDYGVGSDLPVSLSVFGVTADSPNDTRFSFP